MPPTVPKGPCLSRPCVPPSRRTVAGPTTPTACRTIRTRCDLYGWPSTPATRRNMSVSSISITKITVPPAVRTSWKNCFCAPRSILTGWCAGPWPSSTASSSSSWKALSRELGRRAEALSFWQLSRSSGRGIPIGPGLRPEGAQGSAGNQMALEVEGGVGGGMHRDEALGGSRRLEPLHLTFSSAEGLVGHLGPVVLVSPLFMVGAQADFLERSPVGAQLVGRHPRGGEAVLLQQLANE